MAQTTSMIDAYGTQVEVRRAGDGPPLLYLHGGVGDAEWIPLFDDLAKQFAVHQPLHPGFGRSTGLERIDGIEDLVLHYVDLIEALGLKGKKLNVAGSSFGGWIAVELAHRYPDLIRSLVLISAAGLHLDAAPIAEMFGNTPQETAELLFCDQSHPMAVMLRAITDVSMIPEEILLVQFKAMEALAKVAWNPYFHNPKLEARLGRISAPTLIVWGKQDRLIPLAHGRRYAEKIPGARLEVVDECGHLPVLEKPREVHRLLGRFLLPS